MTRRIIIIEEPPQLTVSDRTPTKRLPYRLYRPVDAPELAPELVDWLKLVKEAKMEW